LQNISYNQPVINELTQDTSGNSHPATIAKSILAELNPPQHDAAAHFEGPILVLAGAGSGKTRVLTKRIANLVSTHDVRPSAILAVTFTNKAAQEMRTRLTTYLGDRARQLWVATFHSAALRILRRHASVLGFTSDFVVYDEQDSKSLMKQVMKELNVDERKFPASLLLRIIDQAKNAYVLPDEFKKKSGGFGGIVQAEVYEEFQKSLFKANAMDFGDLLVNVLVLFEKSPEILRMYQHSLRFVLVDEFQDTNKVQYQFVRLITAKYRNLFVVGDDDQSIYSFRGATIRNILDFERDFPQTKVVALEQNYRSTGHILDAAYGIISKNKDRKPKKLWTDQGLGEQIQTFLGDDESEEARFIARKIKLHRSSGVAFSDMAVFYRTNAQSRAIEEALLEAGVPYRIYGGLKFYERKEIKDVLAYLRLLANPADNQAFLRVVNTPTRGVGPQAVKAITERASIEGISLYEASVRASGSAGLKQFVAIIEELKSLIATKSLSDLIADVIKISGYGAMLDAGKDALAESRSDNLRELAGIANVMETQLELESGLNDEESERLETTTTSALRHFLDRVSLTAGNDLPVEESKDNPSSTDKPNSVTLMTLHLAKGLEYQVVFMTGLEEGLLPHYRSMDDPTQLAEERRICYVGTTRAMRTLYFTRASTRSMFSAGGGGASAGYFRQVSRFIHDVPAECLKNIGPDFLSSGTTDYYDEDIRFSSDESEGSRSSRSYPGQNSSGRRFGEKSYPAKSSSPSRYAGSSQLGKGPGKGIPAGLKIKGVTTAEKLKEAPDLTANLTPLEASQVATGTSVVHPSFGRGMIEEVSGKLDGDPKKIKMSVRFEELDQTKVLIFKYARLAIPTA